MSKKILFALVSAFALQCSSAPVVYPSLSGQIGVDKFRFEVLRAPEPMQQNQAMCTVYMQHPLRHLITSNEFEATRVDNIPCDALKKASLLADSSSAPVTYPIRFATSFNDDRAALLDLIYHRTPRTGAPPVPVEQAKALWADSLLQGKCPDLSLWDPHALIAHHDFFTGQKPWATLPPLIAAAVQKNAGLRVEYLPVSILGGDNATFWEYIGHFYAHKDATGKQIFSGHASAMPSIYVLSTQPEKSKLVIGVAGEPPYVFCLPAAPKTEKPPVVLAGPVAQPNTSSPASSSGNAPSERVEFSTFTIREATTGKGGRVALVFVKKENNNTETQVGRWDMPSARLQPVLKALKLRSPAQLKDRSFQAPASANLTKLARHLRFLSGFPNLAYTPPSFDEVRTRMAQTVVRGQCPTAAALKVDQASFDAAFGSAQQGSAADQWSRFKTLLEQQPKATKQPAVLSAADTPSSGIVQVGPRRLLVGTDPTSGAWICKPAKPPGKQKTKAAPIRK